MEDDRSDPDAPHLSLSLLGGLVFLWRARKLGVRATQASDACADLATALAADGREDSEAVGALTTLARGHRRRLTMAAQRVNIEGRAYERNIHNGAYRLLNAALAQAPVEPPSLTVKARIDTLEYLVALPLPDAFALLSEREPRLRPIEAHVRDDVERAGRAGIDLADFSSRELVELRGQIWQMLKPCVGLDSATDDEILNAATSHQLARRYLHSLIT